MEFQSSYPASNRHPGRNAGALQLPTGRTCLNPRFICSGAGAPEPTGPYRTTQRGAFARRNYHYYI